MALDASEVNLKTLLEQARCHMHARMNDSENAINNAFARVALQDETTQVYPIVSSAQTQGVHPHDFNPVAKSLVPSSVELSVHSGRNPMLDVASEISVHLMTPNRTQRPTVYSAHHVGHSANRAIVPIDAAGEAGANLHSNHSRFNNTEYDKWIAQMQQRKAQRNAFHLPAPAITATAGAQRVNTSSTHTLCDKSQAANSHHLAPVRAEFTIREGNHANNCQLTNTEAYSKITQMQKEQAQGMVPGENPRLALVHVPKTDGESGSFSSSSHREMRAIDGGANTANTAKATLASLVALQEDPHGAHKARKDVRAVINGQYDHNRALLPLQGSPSATEQAFPKKKKKNKSLTPVRELQVQEPDPEGPNILQWESWALRLLIKDQLGLDEAAIREYLMIEYEEALLRKDDRLKLEAENRMRQMMGVRYSTYDYTAFGPREAGQGCR